MKRLLPTLLVLAACNYSTDSPSATAVQERTEPINQVVDAQYGDGETHLGESLQHIAKVVDLELFP